MNSKKLSIPVLLLTATMLLAVTQPATLAQFIPCKIVNLNPIPPAEIQAGQPFQVTTKLTVSCDLSVVPVIRVTLRDATSRETLSTTTVPYPPAASFVTSVVNQATARQLLGSWALEIEVDVISTLGGYAVASTTQLFQVIVEPYSPAVTQTQTTETTAQASSAFSAVTPIIATTVALQNLTEASESTQVTFSAQLASSSPNELLVPVAILLAGLLIFGILMFAGRRRRMRRTAVQPA